MPIKIPKEKAWAPLTWFLFHSLAENINILYFEDEKENLFNFIKKICNCLPCPYCAKDATKILNSFNFNVIQNKDDFKTFLFNFHNIINNKLKKNQYDKNVLEKYKKLNLIKCINDWKNYFRTYEKNYRDFITPTVRAKCIKSFCIYIKTNLHKFQL